MFPFWVFALVFCLDFFVPVEDVHDRHIKNEGNYESPKSPFFSHSTRLLAATTLRNVLGTKNLAEILSERETIAHIMQSSLDEATDPWGVKVERVEM